ncbi:MAG: ATPase F0F1 [Rickettsiales bacterium]|nr:ATPase F0F1 [Rickettsiales bacterium]|tara:strand:+ start:1326 stop:1685 length:360 start_codon:yes stop_codon:yes gene_type:complete
MTDDDRFSKLDEKLKSVESNEKSASRGRKLSEKSFESKSAMGVAFRIGIEFVSAVAIGCGLGLIIDNYFGTSPWGMVILFFIGCGAGFSNVYKTTQRMSKPVGLKPENNPDNVHDDGKT